LPVRRAARNGMAQFNRLPESLHATAPVGMYTRNSVHATVQ